MRPVACACWLVVALSCVALASGCGDEQRGGPADMPAEETPPAAATRLATFGGGCFWCVEAVFEELEGVQSVASGYAGGQTEDPTYEAVCSGMTGHAEVVQVRYDPALVAYEQLLEVFFKTHDPTTPNRQGADVGTQYRSAIFTHDEAQAATAAKVKAALDASGAFPAPIVTEIAPLDRFYPAEDYHQDYFSRNPEKGYCQAVIAPKLDKFRQVFQDRLKSAR